MEDSLSLLDIFKLFKQNLIWLFVSIIVTICGMLLIVNVWVAPQYSATTELALGITNGEQSSLNDVNFNLVMMNTYESLIKSSAVLSEVQKTYPDVSTSELKEMVAVITEENSQIFSIQVTTSNPEQAAGISTSIAETFTLKAKEILDSQQKISIITPAEIPQGAIFPNKKLCVLLGIFLGMVFWLLGIVISLALDKTVKSAEYVEEKLQIIHLGKIGTITEDDVRMRKNKLV